MHFSLAGIAILSEGINLVEVNPGLIIWVAVTFIILVIVLKKIAWKPILTALAQRESVIRESLEKAEKAKEEAQKVLDENKVNLAKAEEESKKIIDQSRVYAEKLKEQMLHESKQQAQKIISDAAEEIERRKESAFNELKNQIAEIAVQASEKILKENINKETNKKIVNDYISEITKN